MVPFVIIPDHEERIVFRVRQGPAAVSAKTKSNIVTLQMVINTPQHKSQNILTGIKAKRKGQLETFD